MKLNGSKGSVQQTCGEFAADLKGINSIGGRQQRTIYHQYLISNVELFIPISDHSDIGLNFDLGY
jgi:hypothetical protein